MNPKISLTSDLFAYLKGALALGAVFAAIAIWWVYGHGVHPETSFAPQIGRALRVMRVSASPLVSTLDVVGSIRPASVTLVVAPFSAFIKNKFVDEGAIVHAGDALLELETGELDGQLRDAESTLIKAEIAVDKVEHWDTSTEVLSAKRALAAAEAQLAKDARAQKDAKALFDKGIISRDEFDATRDQADAHRNAMLGAQQGLADSLEEGDPENKRIANLELQSARARMTELKQEGQRAIVRASHDGLLLQAPASSPSNASPADKTVIAPGIQVSRRQVLFSLADIKSYVAEARVDEVDVDAVHVGQTVEITSDSFPGGPINGRIISVGVEADQDAGMASNARYVARALFSVPASRRTEIRVGMSAHLRIETYSNGQALVIPQSAIVFRGGQTVVSLVDLTTHQTKIVPVELGVATAAGIEVKRGLAAGALLQLP